MALAKTPSLACVSLHHGYADDWKFDTVVAMDMVLEGLDDELRCLRDLEHLGNRNRCPRAARSTMRSALNPINCTSIHQSNCVYLCSRQTSPNNMPSGTLEGIDWRGWLIELS